MILFACLFAYNLSAQVAVHRNFNLELAEKDSLTSTKIEQALNGFLAEAQAQNYTEKYIDSTHLLQYEFFFEKLAGIGKHPAFEQPLVLKSYPVGDGIFRLSIGFTGVLDSQVFIYQITELKAVPYQNHYRFFCPFEDNTQHFLTKRIDHVTYHYSTELDQVKATQFVSFTQDLAELTEGPLPQLDYYAFRDLDELLKAYGFLYSARQCNFLCYDLGFADNGGNTFLTGTNNENYIFGYLGEYLYYHLPDAEQIYWPFVQGLSAYYGGYGLSYDDMAEMKEQFRQELKANPEIDFLAEFKKGRKSSVNRHFSFYVMSAFLFEKALEVQDFAGAFSLVYSGSEGERFFEKLEELLSITEDNFHETIVAIISG